MRKTFFALLSILAMCVLLSACGCNHQFDNGEIKTEASCISEGMKTYTCTLCGKTTTEPISKTSHTYISVTTKEPTFTEEGKMTYTCSNCGDSYSEILPVRDDKIVVSVTNKKNIPQDINAWRYSDRVEFTFKIENMTNKTVKGIQGTLHIKDLFGGEILSINCDFTGNNIQANNSITIDDLGIDINQFIDSHVKLYKEKFSDLKFEYEVSSIVFADGSSTARNDTTVSVQSDAKVVVTVSDKYNLDINYDAGRFSPRVEFGFNIANKTNKDIKGIQGTLHIKDLFNIEFLAINCDFTGNSIPANASTSVKDLGMDINQFMDDHVKLYNEKYSDLIFEYELKTIVYQDGTNEIFD